MDNIGSDSTPEIERAEEDISDLEEAGYQSDSVDQQVRANEDAEEEAAKGGYDKPGGRPTGEA